MANMIVAPAIVLSLVLAGQGAAVLAKENGLHREHAIGAMVAAGTGGEIGTPDPTVSSGSKSIRIYLGIQQAFLIEKGQVVKTYRISSGKDSTPTPDGVFRIYKKQDLRISKQEVPYRMPNYMAFTSNNAFGLHGLPYLGGVAEDSAYWKEARTHIGVPVSHGCIRFLPEEAAEIYRWADVGMPVYIQI